jgi:hypothetical protein
MIFRIFQYFSDVFPEFSTEDRRRMTRYNNGNYFYFYSERERERKEKEVCE